MQDFGRVIDWRNDRRWAYVLFPIVLCHLSHSRVRTSLDVSGSIEFAKTLHTKQSFQSNKTLRKLCGVLATYQGLFFQKKSLSLIWGGTTERKLYKKT